MEQQQRPGTAETLFVASSPTKLQDKTRLNRKAPAINEDQLIGTETKANDIHGNLSNNIQTFRHISSSFVTRCHLNKLLMDGEETLHTAELAAVFRSIKELLISLQLFAQENNDSIRGALSELKSDVMNMVVFWKKTLLPRTKQLGDQVIAGELEQVVAQDSSRNLMDAFIFQYNELVEMIEEMVEEQFFESEQPSKISGEAITDDPSTTLHYEPVLVTLAEDEKDKKNSKEEGKDRAPLQSQYQDDVVINSPIPSIPSVASKSPALSSSPSSQNSWNIDNMYTQMRKLRDSYDKVVSRQRDAQQKLLGDIRRQSDLHVDDEVLRRSILSHKSPTIFTPTNGTAGEVTRGLVDDVSGDGSITLSYPSPEVATQSHETTPKRAENAVPSPPPKEIHINLLAEKQKHGHCLPPNVYTEPLKDKSSDGAPTLSQMSKTALKRNRSDPLSVYSSSFSQNIRQSYDYKNGRAGKTTRDSVYTRNSELTYSERSPSPVLELAKIAPKVLKKSRSTNDLASADGGLKSSLKKSLRGVTSSFKSLFKRNNEGGNFEEMGPFESI